MEQKSATDLVLKAARRLLKPLVRLMIRFEITYPAFIRMMKTLYVEVADEDFQLEGKPNTDSRISVLTGVHRKDVRHFRENPEALEPSLIAGLGAQVVSRWMGDPAYSKDGMPRVLSLHGDDLSFDALVQTISKDVRSRAILDELIRTGTVSETDEGLTLDANAYLPSNDLEQATYFLGRNLQDHMESAVHNISGQEPRYLERALFYDRLSEDSLTILREEAREKGMALLKDLNKRAVELGDRDEGDPDATHRISIGLYYFDEEEPK